MRRLLLILLLSFVAYGSCVAVLRSPYVRDIHPRTVTRYLEQLEAMVQPGSELDEGNARMLLVEAKTHYRYEDMDEHRGTPVAEQLAKQRKRTIEAIERWLRERASVTPAGTAKPIE